MPRSTTTYTLGEVRDRLDRTLDDLADTAADAEEGSDEYSDAVAEASDVEEHLVGVQWLVEQYGADAEVTVGGLTTGEYAQVTDRIADAQQAKIGGAESTVGAARIFFIASGLVDAPFVDAEAEFEQVVAIVREFPPQASTWLEHVIDEETVPADPGNSFSERVQARSTDANESGSPEQH